MAISEERKIYEKAWREKNAEHVIEQKKAWAEKNPEKILQYRKNYRSSPKGIINRTVSSKKRYLEMSENERKHRIFNSARGNAKKKNREFTIKFEDVIWNVFCPVLGIKLNYGVPSNGRESWDSPSFDRTNPDKGYIPGNVVVMSWRANHVKMDSSLEEMKSMIAYLSKKEN